MKLWTKNQRQWRSGSVWQAWHFKATLQHFYTSESPNFSPMNVSIHTYIQQRSDYLLFALAELRRDLLSDWALLDSPENDGSGRPIGFTKLFCTLLGVQNIRTLSHCGSFWSGQKILIVAWAMLSLVPACHFTPAAKTGKQSVDIKKATVAAAVSPYS